MKDLKYIISVSYWGEGGGFEILVKLCSRDKLTTYLMQFSLYSDFYALHHLPFYVLFTLPVYRSPPKRKIPYETLIMVATSTS